MATYLTRNQTNGNQDKWTFSSWVKRSSISSNQCIFATSNGSTTSFDAKFDSSDRMDVYNYLGGGYGALSFLAGSSGNGDSGSTSEERMRIEGWGLVKIGDGLDGNLAGHFQVIERNQTEGYNDTLMYL